MDLLVMGTQGRRGIERVLVGSVAEEVLRTAPCPVLTTRASEENESLDPSVSLIPPVDQVVAPIDFSDASRRALQYASRIATLYEVPLTLLHVINLPHLPDAYGLEFPAASESDLTSKAEAELQMWADDLVGASTDITCTVTDGDPTAAILDAASTPGDLLVMATRGLFGIRRFMLGSVAEGVLRGATGPVISCRSFP